MPATAPAAPMAWPRDSAGWPHHQASRFIPAGRIRWHVQEFAGPPGAPVAWLIHGTGASTHSWAKLAPLLAQRWRVITMDLPGHAFTQPAPPGHATLPGMAAGLSELRAALHLAPEQIDLALGHSAGAAIAVQMALEGRIRPRGIVSLNGALLPLSGLPGRVFQPAAKLLASFESVPRWFARRAVQPEVLERLLAGTGSQLDDEGRAGYARLVGNPGHAAGALAMMAGWDLRALEAALPGLKVPLHLLVGSRDLTVPPAQAKRVALRVPGARVQLLEGLGHLAHEEAPGEVLRRIQSLMAAAGAAEGALLG
jgi:magnesium chelatase accessory protein